MSTLQMYSMDAISTRPGYALHVRDELRVQGHVQPVCARRSTGIFDCLDHDTEYSEAGVRCWPPGGSREKSQPR